METSYGMWRTKKCKTVIPAKQDTGYTSHKWHMHWHSSKTANKCFFCCRSINLQEFQMHSQVIRLGSLSCSPKAWNKFSRSGNYIVLYMSFEIISAQLTLFLIMLFWDCARVLIITKLNPVHFCAHYAINQSKLQRQGIWWFHLCRCWLSQI